LNLTGLPFDVRLPVVVNRLLHNLPLHYLERLAPVNSDEVPASTLLRIVVKTKSHSTMSHDLGNVGFVLATETLLFNP
jgi:hypothetical protein